MGYILQRTFEGATSVKRTRLDLLASKWETLKMGKNDSIADFSAKICSINANEASVLGNKYKESEEEEDMSYFVAFIGITEYKEESEDSGTESEEEP